MEISISRRMSHSMSRTQRSGVNYWSRHFTEQLIDERCANIIEAAQAEVSRGVSAKRMTLLAREVAELCLVRLCLEILDGRLSSEDKEEVGRGLIFYWASESPRIHSLIRRRLGKSMREKYRRNRRSEKDAATYSVIQALHRLGKRMRRRRPLTPIVAPGPCPKRPAEDKATLSVAHALKSLGQAIRRQQQRV